MNVVNDELQDQKVDSEDSSLKRTVDNPWVIVFQVIIKEIGLPSLDRKLLFLKKMIPKWLGYHYSISFIQNMQKDFKFCQMQPNRGQ